MLGLYDASLPGAREAAARIADLNFPGNNTTRDIALILGYTFPTEGLVTWGVSVSVVFVCGSRKNIAGSAQSSRADADAEAARFRVQIAAPALAALRGLSFAGLVVDDVQVHVRGH